VRCGARRRSCSGGSRRCSGADRNDAKCFGRDRDG
jgi:hypothetical protein